MIRFFKNLYASCWFLVYRLQTRIKYGSQERMAKAIEAMLASGSLKGTDLEVEDLDTSVFDTCVCGDCLDCEDRDADAFFEEFEGAL